MIKRWSWLRRRDDVDEDEDEDEAGAPVDYRFSLANERTMLAWVRTALALVVGAIATAELASSNSVLIEPRLAASLLLVLATIVAMRAYVRYDSNERAMRAGRPLGRSKVLTFLTLTVAIMSLLLGAGHAVSLLLR